MSEKKLSYYQQLILWELSQKPGHSADLVDRCKISRSASITNLRKLHKAGLIHEVGLVQTHGICSRLWTTLEKPQKPDEQSKTKNLGGPSRTTYALIRDALSHCEMTAQELASYLGREYASVKSCVSYWRNGNRKGKHFKISNWQSGEKGPIPVYSCGAGRDAIKPPRMDQRERQAVWREKNRAELRLKNAAYKAKKQGREYSSNPFSQLFHVTGSTLAASKHQSKLKAQELEAA